MIAFRGFRKTFGAQVAVDDLTLDVQRGETLALLGPNGSGKTTSLKAAAGLITPDRRARCCSATPARRAPSRTPAQPRVLPAAARGVPRCADGSRGRRVLPARCAARRPARTDEVLRVRVAQRRRRAARSARIPAACCSGSAWPSRCCPTRRSSCWTSRPPRSIPTGSRRSTRSSSATPRRAAPCCSPRTSWATSNGSRIASPSSSRAASPPSLTQRELHDRLAQRGVMRVRLGRPPARLPLRRVRGAGARQPTGRRRDSSCPARRRSARRRSTPCAPRASTILGLTAEEGRLDAFYRELVGEARHDSAVLRAARWRSSRPRAAPASPGAGGTRHAQRRVRRVPDDGVERALRVPAGRARRGAAVLRRPRLPGRLSQRTPSLPRRARRVRRRPPSGRVGARRARRSTRGSPALETPMGSHVVAHASAASRDGDPAATGGAAVDAASPSARTLPGRVAMTAVSHVAARCGSARARNCILAVRSRWTQTFAVAFARAGARRGRVGIRALRRQRRAGLRAHGRVAGAARRCCSCR